MVTLLQMIGASFLLVQIMMFILWLIYYQRGNAGIVDIGWAVGFILTTVAYFFLGYGSLFKTLVLLIMVILWAGRLAYHLYRRYSNGKEDERYTELRERWGASQYTHFRFLILFVFQGVLITVLSLPFLLVSCCPQPVWTGWEVFGIFLWAVGLAGEYFADEQLHQFKESGKPGVCNIGLWNYSRHPNYFFEWIVWLGFAFYAFPTTAGLLAFISPVIMYYLLRHVSGVPLTEAHLLRTKGEDYKQYQAKTSEFYPWFPKR